MIYTFHPIGYGRKIYLSGTYYTYVYSMGSDWPYKSDQIT